ncbi:MAG: DNA/RNA non-specific endonuclease [Saprospiraceae bacterium]|nr:DNA/RNA non-specific endonuclease [Saprospiraceae bacterium]
MLFWPILLNKFNFAGQTSIINNMALRRNHTSSGRKGTGFLVRLFIFMILLVTLLVWVYYNRSQLENYFFNSKTVVIENDNVLRTYLPTSNGQVLHKKYYSLSYLPNKKCPEWVAYPMKKQYLKVRNIQHRLSFEADPELNSGGTSYYDYSGSGYERGHLVPAADMNFDMEGLKETYLFSNIVPQQRNCNLGVWRELEKQVRDWVYKYDELYIISGTVFSNNKKGKKIEKSGIFIPDYLFKVILIYKDDKKSMVGFLIPNSLSEKHLYEHVVEVDELEKMTGIDFFNLMLDDKIEEKLESETDLKNFPVSEARYKLRIEKWNLE